MYVICEDVYYKSDFKRLKQGKYLTNVQVICPQHSDIDLTSKYNENVLNNTTRQIIAQVKLKEQDISVLWSIYRRAVRRKANLEVTGEEKPKTRLRRRKANKRLCCEKRPVYALPDEEKPVSLVSDKKKPVSAVPG